MTYAKHARSGFSLIEILIAVAIMAVIGVIGYQFVAGKLEASKKSAAKITMKQIQQALELFSADVGEYPETLKDLTTKPADDKAAARWNGPYMKEVPAAPWGNKKFSYQLTEGQEQPYELYFVDSDKKSKISVWNV